MPFIDTAKIIIKSGNGGDGCAAFHREKYVARGGPSGGDGGKGGDLSFYADERMSTLLDFRYQRHFRAQNGENGKAELMTGHDGENLVIHVPVGTVVRDIQTGMLLADMDEAGKIKTVLHGGRGGKGNARFATPTRQAPRFAQPGEKTAEREVELELKTIADVGLIGLPSVGKSTILSIVTAAKPKIAAYHFTTLSPNLGIASRHGSSFTIADIPGLIEGAAEGAGLGHDFLRHIERTRMLIHVLDISGSEGRDPLDDYEKINLELGKFSDKLTRIPQIVAANKMDLPDAAVNLDRFRKQFPDVPIYPVSAATLKGIDALLDETCRMLDTLPPVMRYEEEELAIEPQYEKGFSISLENGVYVLKGGEVDRILDTTDPNDEESMRRFQQMLIRTGMIQELREMGAHEGDTIRMGEWELDFVE